MGLISATTSFFLSRRVRAIEAAMLDPARTQEEVLENLLSSTSSTLFGKQHGLGDVHHYEDLAERVPIRTYEEMWPFIERVLYGERDVLWPGKTLLFSKSSGTTGQRSKFIPVTDEALKDCHYKGGKDLIALYLHNHPGTNVLDGKSLAVGGSIQPNPHQPGGESFIGDVSALIMNWLPAWAQFMRTPSIEIAVMADWEEKIEKIATLASKEDVTSLSGVPTWMVLLMQRVLEMHNATDLREIWPNLECFLHGAVSFAPYRRMFNSFVKGAPLQFMETYNASEGFFGMQDSTQNADGEMALMLNYGVFYEFIPASEHRRTSEKAIPLWEVETGVNYAVVISTNSGLWRYALGDTIRFTSTAPYRFKISGRTKHFINAFGEEVVVENAEVALSDACEKTASVVRDFTVAPVYMGSGRNASHEWVIEFEREPENMSQFAYLLDEKLREVNSDYDAKRYRDLALHMPVVKPVLKGTFYRWLQSKGKLGGQHKVPRLSNSREFVDEILAI